MTIPLQTTSITVTRPDVTKSAYDASYDGVTAPSTIVTNIPAHFSSPRGKGEIIGGEQEVIDMVLLCELCDLQNGDFVTDLSTNEQFQVLWVKKRLGLGLDHLQAGVRVVVGAAVA